MAGTVRRTSRPMAAPSTAARTATATAAGPAVNRGTGVSHTRVPKSRQVECHHHPYSVVRTVVTSTVSVTA